MSAAVVTGAGRGIGRGIALRLARDGHAVAVNDVNKAAAEAVAEEITSAGGRAIAVPGDVTDRNAVFAMVEQVASELGSVDVMVANAGIAQVKTLLEVTPDGARVDSYFTVITEIGLDHHGRYRDVLEPVGDEWLIRHRYVSTDWRDPRSTMAPPSAVG